MVSSTKKKKIRAQCYISEHLGRGLVSLSGSPTGSSDTQAQIHSPLLDRVTELGFLSYLYQAFISRSDSPGQGKWH